MLSEFTAANIESQQKLIEQHGVIIRNFPKEVFKKILEISNNVVSETANQGKINKEIYSSWSNFKNNTKLRAPYAEFGYLNLSN